MRWLFGRTDKMTKFQTLSATMNHRASVSLVLVVKMMFANAAAAMPPQLYCHLLSLVVVGCAAVVQIWSKLALVAKGTE